MSRGCLATVPNTGSTGFRARPWSDTTTRIVSVGKGTTLLDGLVPLAEKIGLDGGEFRACLEAGKFAARVQEDYEEGVRIGINGTPGNVLLNNQTGTVVVRAGAIPAANLKNAIDGLLR